MMPAFRGPLIRAICPKGVLGTVLKVGYKPAEELLSSPLRGSQTLGLGQKAAILISCCGWSCLFLQHALQTLC